MKTQEQVLQDNSDLIVSFQIGGGHRQGGLTYIGERDINSFTSELFEGFENRNKVIRNLPEEDQDEAKALIVDENWDELYARFEITEDDLGDRIYFDCNGNEVGLNIDNDGTGRIDQDGDYDTIYACRVSELDDNEISAILYRKGGYYGHFAQELQEANEQEEE